jgi:hypothetical protein
VLASSIALTGFGLDSVIEFFAAWRRRCSFRRRCRAVTGNRRTAKDLSGLVDLVVVIPDAACLSR